MTGIRRIGLGLLVLAVVVAGGSPGVASSSGRRPGGDGGAAILQRVEALTVRPGVALAELAVLADRGVGLAEAQMAEWSAMRERVRAGRPLAVLGPDELRRYFHPPGDFFGRREWVGFRALRRLAIDAAVETRREERARLEQAIREVGAALSNNRRSPAPERVGLAGMLGTLADHLHNPVGEGRSPATNLEPGAEGVALDRLDPGESTFWRRPGDVPTRDLYHGFGRTAVPGVEQVVWEYAGPKTSYGGNPGFELSSALGRLKVKFGEVHSEPFVARVFWALGYEVEPVDHARALKLRYDRRLFREFHLRREIKTDFSLAGSLRLFSLELQRRWDPFAFIDHAVLRDGSRVEGRALKHWLLARGGGRHPEDDAARFREEREGRIEYLVTVPANVQFRVAGVASVGPWDFGQLDHANRRELRGLALLAAWVGWYDSRFENTRLKCDLEGERVGVRHVLSDLGGGLGRGAGFFSGRGELPSEFGWTFTRSVGAGGRRVGITGFRPIEDTASFERMTWEDARWMGRLIGTLTEGQLEQALAGAGLDSARACLYREKLVSRRDAMIRDLGLAGEVGWLRPGGVDRRFNYDPRLEGPLVVRIPGGGVRVVPVTASGRIERGRFREGGEEGEQGVGEGVGLASGPILH